MANGESSVSLQQPPICLVWFYLLFLLWLKALSPPNTPPFPGSFPVDAHLFVLFRTNKPKKWPNSRKSPTFSRIIGIVHWCFHNYGSRICNRISNHKNGCRLLRILSFSYFSAVQMFVGTQTKTWRLWRFSQLLECECVWSDGIARLERAVGSITRWPICNCAFFRSVRSIVLKSLEELNFQQHFTDLIGCSCVFCNHCQ